jgi:hypothetical protein
MLAAWCREDTGRVAADAGHHWADARPGQMAGSTAGGTGAHGAPPHAGASYLGHSRSLSVPSGNIRLFAAKRPFGDHAVQIYARASPNVQPAVDINDDTIMVANRERTMNRREDATAGPSGCRRRLSLWVE